MFESILFLIIRIISNPFANMFQKGLTKDYSAFCINFYTYLIMIIFTIPFFNKIEWSTYPCSLWFLATLAGLLCLLSTVCLIKSLKIGEISALSPINSYKCIIGLIFGGIFLGEIPNLKAFLGVALIIYGTKFIFDEGFSIKLFKRKDIQLRFLALFLSALEAVILKKIIFISSPLICFIFWVFTGVIFSGVFLLFNNRDFKLPKKKDMLPFLMISICLFLMQLSTNFVFKNIDVGLSLALFQLSSVVSVLIGWKVFKEGNILKKLSGALIMIIGAMFILIK